MPGGAVGMWLAAQIVIEVLLCGIIIYYVYREKTTTRAAKHEQMKTETLIHTLDRLVEESEDLEKKHLNLLDLWKKIEKRGEELEAHIDFYKREGAPSASVNRGKEESKDGEETGLACYEKTLRLINEGMSVGEIAQEVGLPRGEVELIVNLRGH